MKNWIVPEKKVTVKAKVKPPVSIQKHKVTFEVRKQITELATSLPTVPYFIKGSMGQSVLQYMRTTVLRKGEDLLAKDPLASINGEALKKDQFYVYRNQKVRILNHKVELHTAYQTDGQQGIDIYSSYVKRLAEFIEAEGKALEEKKNAKATVEVSDPTKPYPKDFGMNERGVWEVEGGEQAYDKAFAEWSDTQQEKFSDNEQIMLREIPKHKEDKDVSATA